MNKYIINFGYFILFMIALAFVLLLSFYVFSHVRDTDDHQMEYTSYQVSKIIETAQETHKYLVGSTEFIVHKDVTYKKGKYDILAIHKCAEGVIFWEPTYLVLAWSNFGEFMNTYLKNEDVKLNLQGSEVMLENFKTKGAKYESNLKCNYIYRSVILIPPHEDEEE